MIALVADPALPQRDVLLDPREASRILGERLLAGGRPRVEVGFAKYRPGESLRVAYRVELDGGCRHVALRTFADSERAYRRALPAADGLRPVAHAPEVGAVLWAFPNDRRLTSLATLDGESAALARLLGCAVTARVVAYAPERSASAQCLDGDGRVVAYAKLQGGDSAGRDRRGLAASAAAADDPDLRLPRLLGGTGDTVLLEPVPGRSLDSLPDAQLPGALLRLGAALGALHTLSPPPATRFDRPDAGRLATAAAVVARARPDAAAAAERLLGRLVARRPDDAPAVCLHGDANLRNALITPGPSAPTDRAEDHDGPIAPFHRGEVSDGRVALIDLEDVSAGPAAADLGQVLAVLLARGVDAGGALLAGYARRADPPGASALRWHTAASVLGRVALPAVTHVRRDLLERLPALLDAAGELLA
ncbi:MAG TPA: phosphotransferase [Solirubrobacteraceae bacterium]